MNKIVQKNLFYTLNFQWCLNFLEKILICFQKVNPVKELPRSKCKSFLESILDLN